VKGLLGPDEAQGADDEEEESVIEHNGRKYRRV
jgi:hypothetical protein